MTPNFEREAERIVLAGYDAKWKNGRLRDEIAQALRAAYQKAIEDAAKSFDHSIETLQMLVKAGSPMTARDLRLHQEWRDRIRALTPGKGGRA